MTDRTSFSANSGLQESVPLDDSEIRIPALTLLIRALRRQCPICGSSGIWKSWIEVKEECPNCHYRFVRENGYFLGAMILNVIFAEFLVMALMVVLLIKSDMIWWRIELIILPLAIITPILWNPYFKGFWFLLDLTAHPVKARNVHLPADQAPATRPGKISA
jgi:uncharacterized protein (DUF983 family)